MKLKNRLNKTIPTIKNIVGLEHRQHRTNGTVRQTSKRIHDVLDHPNLDLNKHRIIFQQAKETCVGKRKEA